MSLLIYRMAQAELKLCPFCGSRWQIKKHIFKGHPKGMYLANCRGCHTEIAYDFKRRTNAVKAVNRRI